MECNRDEAARAKTIAERKLTERDYVSAKKFALKAQALYPGLEGVSQMLTTLDVYISAENKVSGEIDWYGILGVNPSADEETVRKQYRKLALMLHPDKNKSVGADGAFKLVSEAWSLLSDKARRLAYNQRRSLKGFQQKVPTQSGGPSAAPSANGFYNFTKRGTSNPRNQSNTNRVPHSSVPPTHQRNDTFWTICNRCMMHYEYLKMYLNHTLLCPNCHEAFLATEMAPPFNFPKSADLFAHQRQRTSGNHVPSSNEPDLSRGTVSTENVGSAGIHIFNDVNAQHGMYSRTTGIGAEPSIAAKAANVVQRANEKMKREREESQAPAGWEGNNVYASFKKRRVDGVYGGNMAYQMPSGIGAGSEDFSGLRKVGVSAKFNSTRELNPFELRQMLMHKAWKEISKKLNDWKSEAVTKAANKEREKVKVNKKEKEKSDAKSHTDNLSRNGESAARRNVDQVDKCLTSTSADDAGKEVAAPASMNVPDPDFHNFDLDRTESSFGDNQVWAAYDNDDGMPRFYAIIHKVISRKPFKMKISWLNSKTNSEFAPVEWVGSGFSKTSGEFRVGRYENTKLLNSFSHKVNWTKGLRGTILILPKKGDVWALYRNWSSDWNEHTPDEVIHKYDMVEVLDDYNEEQGVSVAPLVKVTGLRTVFYADMDPQKVQRIPKEQMFRFSHQVPNYFLTGQEAKNAPKGCLELDPAATPLELLQVITKANEVPEMETGGKVNEQKLANTPERGQLQ